MSLLTPPNSSHRSDKDKDKENKLPVAGPSTRTVVWASHDSFHCLSTPPKDAPGSSKHRPDAKKSILKKSCQSNSSLTVPQIVEQRDVTPEPSDALLDLHYLDHPLSQILAKRQHNKNLGQIIEGYNVLAARLRASVTNATDGDASWPLFQPLRKNAQALVDAIVRDLGCAFINPLSSFNTDEDKVLSKVTPTLPSPKASPSKKKGGMTEEQVKHARDLCTTSHSVIKLLSFMLSVSAVFNVFQEAQLRDILTAVLAIPLADDLPTPNARKTCALSIWLLQVQRLPAAILQPAADRIAYALRRGIDGELGKEGKKGSANDSLKAIHDLCIHEPTLFVSAFAPLIPSILSKLLANTLALRTQACHALGGFVLGSTTIPLSPIHTQVSRAVATYLTTATRSPGKNSPEKPAEAAIMRTLKSTLVAEDPEHVAQGPVWALSVLATFIVLLGSRISEDMRINKIISSLLGTGFRHKKSSIRALSSLLIRPLAWVYFQPPLPVDSDEESEVDDEVRVQRKEARRIHLKMLQTAVECKAGVSTIGALLGEELSGDIPLRRSIEILQYMAGKPGKTCEDAVDVMQCMVSSSENAHDNGVDHAWSSSLLIPRSLFSSFPGLLTAEFKSLKDVVEPIFEQVSTVEDIRRLTPEEISTPWVFTEMMRTWWIVLGTSHTFDGSELPANAIDIWAGLLKANVGWLQETGDDDATAAFGLRAVKHLVDALEDVKLDFAPKQVPATTSVPVGTIPNSDDFVLGCKVTTYCTDAALRLVVVSGLWQTMKTIFPQGPLIAAAETLLACLVKNEASLLPENARMDGVFESDSGESARSKWVSLCVSVLGVCDADAVRAFWGYGKSSGVSRFKEKGFKWTPDFTNTVWRSSAEEWRDGEGHWEGAVVLLGVPFTDRHAWNIGSDDYSLWEELLNYTTNKALDHGVDSSVILDSLADFVSCFQTPGASPTSSIRLVDNLLSHLETSEMRDIPQNLLELVSDTMRATYPPEPRNKGIAMWLVRSLMGVVENCPVEFCLSVLQTVKESLCLWFADECGAWTEDHLTYDIIPLYQHVLVRIRALPENLATLEELSEILDAIFRQRVPLAAAEAFIDYWEMSYSRIQVPKEGWPLAIRHCLSAVGLLPKEAGVEQPEKESALEPAFITTVPRTPIATSFTTPPAALKREAFTMLQSPQRPQKMFGPFPIIPSSPVSPLLRRSSDLAVRRTPLSSIQLCGSPSKRRRLAVDHDVWNDEKENLGLVSVVDRIAAMTPGATKKRRHGEVEDEADERTSGPSEKKLKSSMRPRTRSASKKLSQRTSPACSVTSSNESEDERRWVEATLTQMIPFPVTETQDDGCGRCRTPALPQRKRHVRTVNNSEHPTFHGVLVPSRKRKAEREHSTSLDGSGVGNQASSSRMLDLRKLPMRRSASIPESMLTSRTEKKRKHQESDAGDSDDNSLDLYDLVGSDPLPALQLPPPPIRQLRKVYSLPSSDSDVSSTTTVPSSDDDPYIGQVTPHHLVSPTLQRRAKIVNSLSWKIPVDREDFRDSMSGSDDSPTKGVVTRQMMRMKNTGLSSSQGSILRALKS